MNGTVYFNQKVTDHPSQVPSNGNKITIFGVTKAQVDDGMLRFDLDGEHRSAFYAVNWNHVLYMIEENEL